MPKPKTDSKLQAKLKNKAFHKGKAGKEGFKGKGKPAAKAAPPVIENTAKFPVLSQLIQDKRSILATEALGKLNFQSKIKLIEELSQYIIMNPENNIMHIQTLLHLSEDDNIIIAKMGLISAAQVFKDCAPLYEINEHKVKEELKKQIAKDERKLVMFEYTFLEGYKKYVGMLSELLKLKPAKFVKSLNIPDLQPEQEQQYIDVCKEYNRVALLCLSELISSLFHLNFRKEIAGLVASKLKSFEPELRSIAVKTAKQFFEDQNPASFETKYDFVFGLSKAFGSTPEQKLPDDCLDCLNHLNLQSNLIIQEETEDKKEDKKKADKNKNLNGKRKGKKLEDEKFKEKMKQEKRLKKELKGELKEAEATTDPKRVEHFSYILPQKTEILMKVFYIYFKILKLQKPSKFLPVAMNGILKFVHLISGDILADLINTLGGCGELLREYHLKHLTDSKDIFHARVSCVFASIEITSQLGRVVELDDKEAIFMLYQLFLDLCRHPSVAKELTKQDQELMVKGVAKIFIQKRQLSLETTASFIKIFLECSIKLNHEAHGFIKTLLFIAKLMIQKYATLNRLLEEDNEGYGFDMYNPNIEDPQATNALRTFIVQDLQNIRKKHPKDADIQTLTKKIEGNEKLGTQLSTLTPMEFFRRYNH